MTAPRPVECWVVMDPRGNPCACGDSLEKAVLIWLDWDEDQDGEEWEQLLKEGWACVRMVPAREADELRAKVDRAQKAEEHWLAQSDFWQDRAERAEAALERLKGEMERKEDKLLDVIKEAEDLRGALADARQVMRDARDCVGGDHPEKGMDEPHDAWKILTDALAAKEAPRG